jgi:hypothetical protein
MEDHPRSQSDTRLARTRVGGPDAFMHHWLRGVSRLSTPLTSTSIDNMSTHDIEHLPHSRKEVKDRMRRYSIARDDAEVERRVMFASRPSIAALSGEDGTELHDDDDGRHEHDDTFSPTESSYQPDEPPLTPGTSVSRVELEIMAEGAPKIVLEAPQEHDFLDVLDETFRRGSVLLDLKKVILFFFTLILPFNHTHCHTTFNMYLAEELAGNHSFHDQRHGRSNPPFQGGCADCIF